MNEDKRLYYLHKMGIQAWVPKFSDTDQVVDQASESINNEVQRAVVDLEELNSKNNNAESFDGLKKIVASCTLCNLHRSRTQTVFGVGHPAADWLIIGEAPGADEDRVGEPFVGRAVVRCAVFITVVAEDDAHAFNTLFAAITVLVAGAAGRASKWTFYARLVVKYYSVLDGLAALRLEEIGAEQRITATVLPEIERVQLEGQQVGDFEVIRESQTVGTVQGKINDQ